MSKPGAEVDPFPAQLDAITSVRFFLALGVVLFHYQLAWTLTEPGVGLLSRGRLGVDIFFVVSGFILTHVYLRQGSKPPIGSFLATRLARIYPAHLAVLAGVVILVLTAGLLGVGTVPGRFNLLDLLASVLLVQAWFPRDDAVFWNGPSWSLSAEWFAYLSFPIFAFIGLRLRRRPLILIALALTIFFALDAAYRQLFGTVLPRAEHNLGVLRIIPEFLLGMGLYWLGASLRLGRLGGLAFASISAALLLSAMQMELDDRAIVLLGAVLVLSLAMLSKTASEGPLSHPLALFAGEASYALYLVHMPVLLAWRNLTAATLGLPGDYQMGMLEIAALLTLTLALAALVHVAVERPARRWLRARIAGNGPMTAAAPATPDRE